MAGELAAWGSLESHPRPVNRCSGVAVAYRPLERADASLESKLLSELQQAV
jgi:hypothetical protein